MRIVHIADLHLGKTLFEIPLIDDQRLWLLALIDALKELRADVLVVAGDVYQRSVPSTEAVSLLDTFLNEVVRKLHIPVLMIAGNHDSGERLGFASRLFEESGLHVSGSVEKQLKTVILRDEYGAVNFVLLPYFEPYPIKKLFDGDDSIKTMNDAFLRVAEAFFKEHEADFNERTVLIAHGFFGRDAALARFSDSERSVGGSDMMDSTLLERFDYVALGHLHAPQTAGAPHIRYAGSPLKYSLSEAGQEKSVTVIDLFEKGRVDIFNRVIPVPHDLRILTGRVEELTAAASLAGQEVNDYIYAVLTDKGEVYGAMEKLRAVYPNIIGLKRAGIEAEAAALSAGLELQKKTPPQLFNEFYKEMLGEDITPEREALMRAVFEAATREEIV